MQKTLINKFVAIGLLTLLLLIPLSLIKGVIKERDLNETRVIADIAKSGVASQKLTGAIIVVPYKERVARQKDVYENGGRKTISEVVTLQKYKYFLPEDIKIKGNIITEERYRGIYKVPVYTSNLTLDGHFILPKQYGMNENIENISFDDPYVVLGIKDIRGINSSVSLYINEQKISFLPGSKTPILAQGIHAVFQSKTAEEQHFNFQIKLELQGMEQLAFSPIGKFTKVHLSSAWPHPSFIGKFLPKNREISENGFEAMWETSFFSSNMLGHLDQCLTNNKCYEFESNSFGVSLDQGVDIYLQAERSTKYAILFIGLTFFAFLCFEILKDLRIHTVQYGLVGIALALFYLLLISLSEHLSFGLSYMIASTACISLLSFYISSVLKSLLRGMSFGGIFACLYGALYLIIGSEDYALLMGSALLFSILTFVMIITRNVDWYLLDTEKDMVNNIAD